MRRSRRPVCNCRTVLTAAACRRRCGPGKVQTAVQVHNPSCAPPCDLPVPGRCRCHPGPFVHGPEDDPIFTSGLSSFTTDQQPTRPTSKLTAEVLKRERGQRRAPETGSILEMPTETPWAVNPTSPFAHCCPECQAINDAAHYSRRQGGVVCEVCGHLDRLNRAQAEEHSAHLARWLQARELQREAALSTADAPGVAGATVAAEPAEQNPTRAPSARSTPPATPHAPDLASTDCIGVFCCSECEALNDQAHFSKRKGGVVCQVCGTLSLMELAEFHSRSALLQRLYSKPSSGENSIQQSSLNNKPSSEEKKSPQHMTRVAYGSPLRRQHSPPPSLPTAPVQSEPSPLKITRVPIVKMRPPTQDCTEKASALGPRAAADEASSKRHLVSSEMTSPVACGRPKAQSKADQNGARKKKPESLATEKAPRVSAPDGGQSVTNQAPCVSAPDGGQGVDGGLLRWKVAFVVCVIATLVAMVLGLTTGGWATANSHHLASTLSPPAQKKEEKAARAQRYAGASAKAKAKTEAKAQGFDRKRREEKANKKRHEAEAKDKWEAAPERASRRQPTELTRQHLAALSEQPKKQSLLVRFFKRTFRPVVERFKKDKTRDTETGRSAPLRIS